MTVYFSPEDIGARFAFLERCRRWAGVRVGQRRATFTGQSIVPERQSSAPFWRYNRPGRQMLFPHTTFRMNICRNIPGP